MIHLDPFWTYIGQYMVRFIKYRKCCFLVTVKIFHPVSMNDYFTKMAPFITMFFQCLSISLYRKEALYRIIILVEIWMFTEKHHILSPLNQVKECQWYVYCTIHSRDSIDFFFLAKRLTPFRVPFPWLTTTPRHFSGLVDDWKPYRGRWPEKLLTRERTCKVMVPNNSAPLT